MFNLKKALQKVFGHKAIKPRKAATALSMPAPATPQVTLDDARRNLVEVLKAVEEKKRAEKNRRRVACQEFFDFLQAAALNDGYEEDDCERVCLLVNICPETITEYFQASELPALAAAVEFFVINKDDFDTGLEKVFETIDSGEYTFFENIFYDDDLGEKLAHGKVDDDIWGYVDFESLGEDYRRDYNGEYVFNGFFAPKEF